MKLGLPPELEINASDTEPRISGAREDLHPGDILDDRFVVTEFLSRGGMATIYKAQDLQNGNEPVVLKVPLPQAEMNPEYFSRFKREEEIGLKLRHPYLLKFVAVNGARSRPYLVTEYVRGVSLYDLLSGFRVLPEADALAVTALLCDGLQYLHQSGSAHRDLKPENIMICYDGTIRIMDFGIASATDSRRLTFMGFAPGTPHYMAPERVKGRRGDPRTDIYSLGAMLYEMLTGVVPFAHEDSNVIMESHVVGDPVPPRQVNSKISAQAEEIVLHAMTRNPAGRYSDVAAMKAELEAPNRVPVTGRSTRVKLATRWRRALRKARFAAVWCLIPVVIQVALFLLLWHLLRKK